MTVRLSLRIPIIRKMLVDACNGEVVLGDYMTSLAKTTKIRRRPNVTKILDLIALEALGTDSMIAKAVANVRREL